MARAVNHRLRPASILAHDESSLPSVVEDFIARPPLRTFIDIYTEADYAYCRVARAQVCLATAAEPSPTRVRLMTSNPNLFSCLADLMALIRSLPSSGVRGAVTIGTIG